MYKGQRIELRFATTEHRQGTVSFMHRDGRFQVSYDSYRVNGFRVPGGRHTYPAKAVTNFAWHA